jgi:hypothetical protein
MQRLSWRGACYRLSLQIQCDVQCSFNTSRIASVVRRATSFGLYNRSMTSIQSLLIDSRSSDRLNHSLIAMARCSAEPRLKNVPCLVPDNGTNLWHLVIKIVVRNDWSAICKGMHYEKTNFAGRNTEISRM